MKNYLKRWNQLAGTSNENILKENHDQNIYGNNFIKELLNEDVGADIKDAKEKESEEGKEAEIGDPEKSTLSDAALAKGLKAQAADIAASIPAANNDEFAEIMNSVKAIAGDKMKLQKVMKFIAKLK
tara:strand:+ start:570 stop:950 length:381 start_codon:yes stop_codon:yes gene_type:complete